MNFKDLLNMLYPPGVFSDDAESDVQKELVVVANAFQRANDNAAALRNEMHPETATVSLASWERILALTPGPSDPIQTRRQRIIAALTAQGGLSRQYFINLAASLGYMIEIDELQPLKAGSMRAGQLVAVPETCFCWRIRVLNWSGKVVKFRAGAARAGDCLGWWPTDVYFEGIMNQLQRASSSIIFEYI